MGYRKVSPEELAKARQAAMMKTMMGGMMGGGAIPNIPDAGDDGDTPAAGDNG